MRNRSGTHTQGFAAILLLAVAMFLIGAGSQTADAKEFKVDKTIVEKYSDPVKALKDSEETLKILEFLVHRKTRVLRRRWKHNIFYPSVEIKVENSSSSSELAAKGTSSSPLESKLIGVVIGKMGSFAIFGDKAIKEGEQIGEIKVVKVSLGSVLIETGDGLKEIILR